MEEMNENQELEQNQAYQPRPAWQVWAARIGVVIVVIAFAIYLYNIANGGIG